MIVHCKITNLMIQIFERNRYLLDFASNCRQPLVDEIGFNLMPNALTEAIIQSVNIQRQKAPFTSNCYDSWTQTNYSEFIDSDLKYSMTQCQRTCTHSSILNDCGCYHAIFVDGDIDDSEPCNMTSTCKF